MFYTTATNPCTKHKHDKTFRPLLAISHLQILCFEIFKTVNTWKVYILVLQARDIFVCIKSVHCCAVLLRFKNPPLFGRRDPFPASSDVLQRNHMPGRRLTETPWRAHWPATNQTTSGISGFGTGAQGPKLPSKRRVRRRDGTGRNHRITCHSSLGRLAS